MENTRLKCPLCCDRQFDSKLQLVEHLSTTLENITCSICNSKWTSISHLIEHLTLDNCQADHTSQTICFDITSEPENNENEVENSDQTPEHIQIEPHKDLSDQHISTINDSIDGGPDMGRMYVEFISKQLTKPCLQTQELKLVKEAGGISRYVFVMNDDDDKDETNADGDVEMDSKIRVITKQNSDGTVSLTTVRDLKMETDTDPLMNQPVDDSQEIYSCNTCGVSFTSVLDHIQNYHNDQDVVVEEPVEDMDGSPNESIELQNEINNTERTEEASADKQLSRRMITETGDIIEAPLVMRTTSILPDENHSKKLSPVKVSTKKLPTPHRRQVVVDSVIKEINQPDDKPGPYHKVVVRMMERTNGETVKIFHCMICQIYVASLDDFKFHPCKRSKYSCMQCPVTYDNAKSLCAHMKVHKAKPAISGKTAQRSEFECEICNTLFTTTKSLKLHKRMHDPIKARPIEPPVETADGLEVSNDKFLCSVCHKLIPIDYRAVHQRSHKGKSGLTCEVCNKEFQSEEYLEMHMNVHLGDKIPTNKQDNRSLPYMCLYCDRRFSRPHEKVKHERIHTGEKPHSCEICGKSFRVSYCLTLHLRTHTGARPYSCPHCGKRFKAHSVYNHHLQTHSEVRAYKCPYCPKAFKTSVQLAGHKNSHTKPFSCQQCNRPFASLYAVRVHQETHARQNSLKFSCALCGASYARAFALKDHIKAVHSEEADKVDIDKTIDSILDKKGNDVLSTVVEKTEDWSVENVEENAAEEITDTKNLTHEVDVSEVFSNGNFPE